MLMIKSKTNPRYVSLFIQLSVVIFAISCCKMKYSERKSIWKRSPLPGKVILTWQNSSVPSINFTSISKQGNVLLCFVLFSYFQCIKFNRFSMITNPDSVLLMCFNSASETHPSRRTSNNLGTAGMEILYTAQIAH